MASHGTPVAARRHASTRPRLLLACSAIAALGVALLILASCAPSALPWKAAPKVTPPRGKLVFSDEFEGDSLDTTKWNAEMQWGPDTLREMQHYDRGALDVRGGVLYITASESSQPDTNSPDGPRPYRSGVIASFDKYTFTYGYAEVRAKVPEGQGLWPAFWLLPQDDKVKAEIDISEILGQEPARTHMTRHWGPRGPQRVKNTSSWRGPDFSKDFHTFGVDWQPREVVWYVDGVERFRVTDHIPNKPMYLIANLAVGGFWSGKPATSTRFPASYEIDYVRVYSYK